MLDPEEGVRHSYYGEDCEGVLEYKQEPCHCAAVHAPCDNCTSGWLECSECGEEFLYENR